MKLEIICLCEVNSSSKCVTGKQARLTSSTLFMIPKKKEKIEYIVNLS
jgi:hypothetical protein